MNFLRIGKSKLKITLSTDDLGKYNLAALDADADLSKHKLSIFKIIDLAESACGFIAGKDKLLIQFYPSDNGGELFVTKLSILTDAQRNIISKSSNLTTLSHFQRAYFFNNINDAISLAKSIASRGILPLESSLYITEEGYVVLDIEEYAEGMSSSEYPEISEYAESLATSFFVYLREHSIPVYEKDAIKELSLM